MSKFHTVLSSIRNGFSYHGINFTSNLHKKSRDNFIGRFRISRELLALFVKSVGRVNSVGMPGLTVAEQGGGWYEVFALAEHHQMLVSRFIARINRWIAQRSTKEESPPAMFALPALMETPVRPSSTFVRDGLRNLARRALTLASSVRSARGVPQHIRIIGQMEGS